MESSNKDRIIRDLSELHATHGVEQDDLERKPFMETFGVKVQDGETERGFVFPFEMRDQIKAIIKQGETNEQ